MVEKFSKNTPEFEQKPEALAMQVVKRVAVVGEVRDRGGTYDQISYYDVGEGGLEKAAVKATRNIWEGNYALVPYDEVRGKVRVGDKEVNVHSDPPKINRYHTQPLSDSGVVFINREVLSWDDAKKAGYFANFKSPVPGVKYVETPKGIMHFREGVDKIIQIPPKSG